ncbi:MAG: aspartate carbamoyltransferase regulatory subunit [Bacteroidales bacterium]|nr:aspartate carbamoyltransferase regulatory subunit [Bacteroidales bacterium]
MGTVKKVSEKTLQVSAIENGTVLDHIPADQLFKVIQILGLDKECKNQITFGTNLESKKLGRKAIIKVADRVFKSKEINKIALVAPDAKINVIKDFKVVEKKVISIPKEIVGIAKCMNPACITNHQPVATRFTTSYENKHLKLLCHYCEKTTDGENLQL